MKSQKGFTLIELLVVISIIALLSSIVLSSVNAAREKAKISRAKQDINTIYKAFVGATLDAGQNYLAQSDSTGQANSGTGFDRWYIPDCAGATSDWNITGNDQPNGEYVKQFATALVAHLQTIPVDPWGSPYWIDSIYVCTSGEIVECTSGQTYFAIGSGGKNKSLPNQYDLDNVVITYCKHP